MKNGRVLEVFTMFALCVVLAPTPSTAQVGDGAKQYPSLVSGLQQFPLGYRVQDDKVMATVIGGGSGPKTETLATWNIVAVTIEGNLLELNVGASPIDLAIFLHEIKPSFGKYKFWKPVLIFSRKKSGASFCYREVEFVGRFFIVYDPDDKNPNRILGYKNEVFE